MFTAKKTKAKKALSLLLALMFMIPVLQGFVPGNATTAHAASDLAEQWNLNNFVSDITIKDSEGSVVTDGNFYFGDIYVFNINFSERTGANGQFEYNDSNRLIYQLPSQIEILSPVTNGTIRVSNGNIIGGYTIDINGCVEVWFENMDNNGEPIEQNFIDAYTDAGFSLDLEAKFVQGTATGEVIFGTDAVITIEGIQNPPAGIKTSKTATAYNKTTETVDFEITITAVGGDIANVTLKDLLTFNIQNNFALKKADADSGFYTPFLTGEGNGFFQYQFNENGSWQTLTSVPWNTEDNGLFFDFSGHGVLRQDEVITIKYTLHLSSVLDYFASQGTTTKWIQRLIYSLTLTNKATAYGLDGSNPVTASSTTTTALAKTFMTKTSSVKKESESSTITWTCTVGDGTLKLNGWTFKDVLGADLKISSPMTVTVYTISSPGVLNTSGKVLTEDEVNACVSGYNVDEGFNFTVPANGFEGMEDVYSVKIVYTSSPQIISGSFTNKLELIYKENLTSCSATATASPDVVIKKTSKVTTSGIDYKISFTIPAGFKDKVLELLDHIGFSNTSYTSTISYKWVQNKPVNFKAVITDLEEGDPAFKYTFYPPQTTDYWYVFFGAENLTSKTNSKWQYDTEKTLEITYTIPFDTPMLPAYTGVGDNLGEVLRLDSTYRVMNKATLRDGATATISSAAVYDNWPLHKTATINTEDETVIDYVVTLNNTVSRTFAYNLFNGELPAAFTDTFDSHLEYVSKSLYVYAKDTISPFTANQYFGPYSGDTTSLIGSSEIAEDTEAMSITGNKMNLNFDKLSRLSWSSSLSNSKIHATPTPGWYGAANRFEIHYQLKLKDEYIKSYDKYTFENIVSIDCNGSDEITGKFSNSNTINYSAKPLIKEMFTDGSNTAEVEILVNPNAAKLIPAGSTDSWISAVDTMDGGLAFYMSTIKIYEDVEGVWVDKTSTVPDSLYSYKSVGAQSVEFRLPDEKSIKITYSAAITAPAGEETSFGNTVTVYGYSDKHEEDKYVVQKTSAGAAGLKKTVTLSKSNEDGSKRLNGAEFKLYMSVKDNGYYGTDTPTELLTINGKNFYLLQSDVTKGNGEISFDSNWITPTHKAVYLLVETTVPDGYILPSSPNNRTFVILHSMSSADKEELETVLGKPVMNVTDNVHITNEKIKPASVKLKANKTAQGNTIEEDQFSFELYRSNAAGAETELLQTKKNAAPVSDVGAIKFDELLFPDNGTYYYLIKEKITTNKGWTLDATQYLVKVVVTTENYIMSAVVTYGTKAVGADSFGEEAAWLGYGENVPGFLNIYTPGKADAVIRGTKRIEGMTESAKEFTFDLIEVTNAEGTVNKDGGYTAKTSVEGAGNFSFTIKNLVPGTYFYKVSENQDGSDAPGWTYDKHFMVAKVVVTDDGKGETTAAVTYPTGNTEFINMYEEISHRLGWMRSTEIAAESFLRDVVEGKDAWDYSMAFTNTPIQYFENETVRALANSKAENGTEYTRADDQKVGWRTIWDCGDYFDLYKLANGDHGYDWASWKHHGISGDVIDKGEYSIRRFTGYYEFSQQALDEFGEITIAPLDELGNKSYLFPVNDNIFVFVNGKLAYWGGTDVVESENHHLAANRTHFAGLKGLKVRNGVNDDFLDIYPHTDGWCIDLDENCADVNIKKYIEPGFNRVDIFLDEYWEGGGMNRLTLFDENNEIMEYVNN